MLLLWPCPVHHPKDLRMGRRYQAKVTSFWKFVMVFPVSRSHPILQRDKTTGRPRVFLRQEEKSREKAELGRWKF